MTSHLSLDQPSAWVCRFQPLISVGEVLDLACGSGRHTRLLAAAGYSVVALDRDTQALGDLVGSGVMTMQHDLERSENGEAYSWPFAAGRFQGIVVTNYLHRPLFDRIMDSLAPGGVLIYETFAIGNEQFGKPSNPNFLLEAGELLRLVMPAPDANVRIVAFEDGYVTQPKQAMVQRICAIKTDGEALPTQRLRLA